MLNGSQIGGPATRFLLGRQNQWWFLQIHRLFNIRREFAWYDSKLCFFFVAIQWSSINVKSIFRKITGEDAVSYFRRNFMPAFMNIENGRRWFFASFKEAIFFQRKRRWFFKIVANLRGRANISIKFALFDFEFVNMQINSGTSIIMIIQAIFRRR